MTGNRCIMFSFTLTSYFNFVELVDGSCAPIQGIGTAATTPNLPLSSVFYLSHFSYNLLSVTKITKALNYTVIFFLTHCVFQKLGMGKRNDTGHERNGLYELGLTFDQVACISTSTTVDDHCRLGHPSVPTLKLFFFLI